MGQFTDWWLGRDSQADWLMPISCVQGFRPVGGYLLGTATQVEFVPNRFEAMVGGSSWTAQLGDIQQITLGRRRLRITTAGAPGGLRTLFTNRPGAVRKHLGPLLAPADVP